MSALDAAVFSIARAISPATSVLSNARASAREDASSAADATRNETPGASSDTIARVSRLVHSAKGLFVKDDDDVGDGASRSDAPSSADDARSIEEGVSASSSSRSTVIPAAA
jgi:hypothetical protein